MLFLFIYLFISSDIRMGFGMKFSILVLDNFRIIFTCIYFFSSCSLLFFERDLIPKKCSQDLVITSVLLADSLYNSVIFSAFEPVLYTVQSLFQSF